MVVNKILVFCVASLGSPALLYMSAGLLGQSDPDPFVFKNQLLPLFPWNKSDLVVEVLGFYFLMSTSSPKMPLWRHLYPFLSVSLIPVPHVAFEIGHC